MDLGKRLSRPPRIFHVNWFRSDGDGDLLWPGYGENIRVLEWMIARIHGDADARSTLLGWVPTPGGLDMSGLAMVDGAYDDLFEIDGDAWKTEADEHVRFLQQFGPRLPDALLREHAALERRIGAARSTSFARGWRSAPRAATH
jgi:phosphoenolpyruvate carboxykinase (GTP)